MDVSVNTQEFESLVASTGIVVHREPMNHSGHCHRLCWPPTDLGVVIANPGRALRQHPTLSNRSAAMSDIPNGVTPATVGTRIVVK